MVRIPTDEVSEQGRNTQGVRLINLGDEEHLVGMAAVQEPEGAEPAEDGEGQDEPGEE